MNDKKEVAVKSEKNQPTFLDFSPQFDPMFDHVVDRFFGNRFLSNLDWPESSRSAATNVRETDKNYILTAEIPGIPKEDIKISVNGNVLTIRAEQKQEAGSKSSEQGYRRHHRSFMQSFSLPTTIDADKIEATSEHGVLEINLPKTEKAQPKQIEVKSGKSAQSAKAEPPRH